MFAGRAPAAGPSAPTLPTSIPEALAAQWRGPPLASRHRGLGPAVHLLGGPDVLLYLFARVSPFVYRLISTVAVTAPACDANRRICKAVYGNVIIHVIAQCHVFK